jgi:UDP-N-acetylglucosamine 4,6-dehydratase
MDMRVLITGGAGSWGQVLAKALLPNNTVCIYSRDEEKHRAMRTAFNDHPGLRFFLGDVRDKERLRRAMHGVEEVYHLAALKQIDACTYNPLEAVATNITGTANVMEAAIDCGVKRVLCMSTDKAVEATTLYGSTKAVVEGLVRNASAYSHDTKFIAVRCGNAWGSRGSIVPVWKRMIAEGATILPVTHPDCTRFHIRMEHTGPMLVEAMARLQLEDIDSGSVVAPDLAAYRVTDLAAAMGAKTATVGLRPNEKIHESMWGRHERPIRVNEGQTLWIIGDGQGSGGESCEAERLTIDELRKELA